MNTIADGYYPLSRPLFIYINTEIAKQRANVREFIGYYIEHATKLVNRVGYFPLSNQQYEEAIDDFERATNQAPLD